ncbi:hypothetical protein C0389_04455 [bacterium]|nr:hypothetical protein [bacterium]
MGRKIAGVLVGYLAMAILVFVCFTVLYLILGAEGSFQEGSYIVSSVWIIFSFIIGLAAAVVGGFVCTLIAKDQTPSQILAVVVLILGIVLAIPAMNLPDDVKNKVREGSVGNMQAMQDAQQPMISLILNPILGATGVFVGGRLKKKKGQ